ncbi:MAG: hypothetical protein WA840_20720 [Caulobacteraceae bacterium]
MYELPKLERVLTAEDFEPWVGRPFAVETEPEPVSIQLLSVDRRPASRFAIRPPFKLVFRSAADVLLIDGLYRMKCDRCGPHEIFLGPILSPPGQRLYEAVFN